MQRPSPVAPPVTTATLPRKPAAIGCELRLLQRVSARFHRPRLPTWAPTEAFEGRGHRRGKVRAGMGEGKDFGWAAEGVQDWKWQWE